MHMADMHVFVRFTLEKPEQPECLAWSLIRLM